jgi:Ca2+/Na+ antiporter
MNYENKSDILQDSTITTEHSLDTRWTPDDATFLWNILFRTLTFILGLRFTILMYFIFFEDISFIKGIFYTCLFFYIMFLLTKLLIIDDEETD